ncbi:MAG: hypothetical protein M3Q48_09780 [Actinomycetota bacterium]|nr:hypothetical protein [Actinomycetota bacterium]
MAQGSAVPPIPERDQAKFDLFWAQRYEENRERRRTNVRLWRSRLRQRQPLDTGLAVALWNTYMDSHGGNLEAALGELVASLMEADLLEDQQW